MKGTAPDARVHIGEWELDLGDQRLHRGSHQRRLNPKELNVLLHLAEAAPSLVTTEALLARSWSNRVVSDGAVYQTICRLRRALGRCSDGTASIETLPKRGYRLTAPVRYVTTIGRADSRPAAAVQAAPPPPSEAPSTVVLPEPDTASVGVLPLDAISLSGDEQALSQALRVDLVTSLSLMDGVRATASDRACANGASHGEPRALARALGVRYLLEGSIQHSGSMLRLHVQLYDARADDPLVWAERLTAPLADLFDLQDEIARRVLGVVKGPGPAPALGPEVTSTRNLLAYRAYARGLQQYRDWDLDGSDMGFAEFARAVQLDGGFYHAALHLAMLSRSRRSERFGHARAVARTREERLQCDARQLFDQYRYDHARIQARRNDLLREYPRNRDFLHGYGCTLIACGLPRTGAAYIRAGLDQLREASAHYWLSMSALTLTELDAAVAHLDDSMRLYPTTLSMVARVLLLGRMGHHEAADSALAAFTRVHGDRHPAWPLLRASRAYWSGEDAVIRELLSNRRMSALWLAFVRAMAGQHDAALAALARGVERGNELITQCWMLPRYLPDEAAALDCRPAFHQLLRELHLTAQTRIALAGLAVDIAPATGIALLD